MPASVDARLGNGPDRRQHVLRVDRCQLPAADPLANVGGIFLSLAGPAFEKVPRNASATFLELLQQHFRGERAPLEQADHHADHAAQRFQRRVVVAKRCAGVQVAGGDVLQHVAVDVRLGLEVVEDVGPRQAGQGGDGRELGGGIALLGERFAGGIEDGAAHGLGRWLFASLGHFSRQLERHDVHGKASLKRAKP
ncbi:hypothetical protein D3C76_1273930 [compost metagenome]